MALECTPGITGAWLNHPGTLLAVVGTRNFTGDRRTQMVKAVLKAEDILPEGLRGEARDAALDNFFVGGDWLRGADVDQLSNREARITGVRLVRRLQANAIIYEEVANSLAAAITEFFEQRFLRDRILPE